MMTTLSRLLVLASLIAAPAHADSLLLPVPGATDAPREKINLSITIPSKVTPKPEEPARERIRSTALSSVDWQPFKGVPQRKFVYETLRIFKKKGLVRLGFDQSTIDDESDLWATTGPVIVRTYERIRDVYRKDALKKFGIVPGDLQRFQRVVDIFAQIFERDGVPVAEVNRTLDAAIEELQKTSGRGQIRITGLREQKDGSTLLEMEIVRGAQYNR